MKRIYPQIVATALLSIIVVSPHIVSAQFGDFIKCGNEGQPDCGFQQLVTLVTDVINGLIKLATLITTGVLAYAGFKMIFSGGDESTYKEAKEMALKTVKGYLWILVAWTLVYTITTVLLEPNNYTNLLGSPN
ncbi:MAG: hypothetical protein WAV25_01800 [Minisyncoccia bacterium]